MGGGTQAEASWQGYPGMPAAGSGPGLSQDSKQVDFSIFLAHLSLCTEIHSFIPGKVGGMAHVSSPQMEANGNLAYY